MQLFSVFTNPAIVRWQMPRGRTGRYSAAAKSNWEDKHAPTSSDIFDCPGRGRGRRCLGHGSAGRRAGGIRTGRDHRHGAETRRSAGGHSDSDNRVLRGAIDPRRVHYPAGPFIPDRRHAFPQAGRPDSGPLQQQGAFSRDEQQRKPSFTAGGYGVSGRRLRIRWYYEHRFFQYRAR